MRKSNGIQEETLASRYFFCRYAGLGVLLCEQAGAPAVAAPRAIRGDEPTGEWQSAMNGLRGVVCHERAMYPPIPSRRERRIYAANAAVQRWAKVRCACGVDMPRKAGANMAMHIWWIDGLSAFNWKKRVVVIA